MICHITTRDAWEAGQRTGQFRSPEFDSYRFIHCSTPEQVLFIANSFFAGRSGLVLLVIDPTRLQSEIRWEPPDAIGRLPEFAQFEVFPHVYGPINTDAVVRTVELVPNDKGAFILPRPA